MAARDIKSPFHLRDESIIISIWFERAVTGSELAESKATSISGTKYICSHLAGSQYNRLQKGAKHVS